MGEKIVSVDFPEDSMSRILYTSHSPMMTVILHPNGEIVLTRMDRYMKNPGGEPAFIPRSEVLLTLKEVKG